MRHKFEFATDAYKISHKDAYPDGTEYIYSNFTPRTSRVEGVDYVISFGLQAAILKLSEMFRDFLDRDIDKTCADYEKNVAEIVGPNDIGSDHFRALHRLGYFPIKIYALPEGTKVPLGVPMFTVENTHPEFFWLTNYLETYLSSEIWLPTTSATTAFRMRQLLNDWALKTTGTIEGVEFQAHDFSMRGMAGTEAAAMSGAGHLLSFIGSDCLPAKDWIKQNYSIPDVLFASEPIMVSVPATEHSVMCSYGSTPKEEFAGFEKLIDKFPNGFLSLVSDGYDFWNVITDYLPRLKDKIMARDGRVVIRPDSGDPADILCGTSGLHGIDSAWDTTEEKGLIQVLWEIFGGTVNDKGFRVLDPHIGAIYGDSITFDRASDICRRLADKGFASTNVVFGLGSFTYTYVTRDTFGFAMKATSVTIDGKQREIFKDPKTGDGSKKSAKGLLTVERINGKLTLRDQLTLEEQQKARDEDRDELMFTVDGPGNQIFFNGYDQIRARVAEEAAK